MSQREAPSQSESSNGAIRRSQPAFRLVCPALLEEFSDFVLYKLTLLTNTFIMSCQLSLLLFHFFREEVHVLENDKLCECAPNS